MSKKSSRQFYYFIVDHDQKLFNYFGPISSDLNWNSKVSDAIDSGRNLQVYSPWTEEEFQSTIQHLVNQGFQHTKELLIDQPVDRSKEFKGSLPEYAKSADRNRIVIFLCRTCSKTRYGEMEVPYPGQDVLRKSDLGSYSVHCLKCGTKSSDPYNWYR